MASLMIEQRLNELERALSRSEGALDVAALTRAVIGIGELARRSGGLDRAGLSARYTRLLQRVAPIIEARGAGCPAAAGDALERRLGALSREQGAPAPALMSLLEEREALEAWVQGCGVLERRERHQTRLSRTLARIDRLGQASIGCFLPLNARRRAAAAELDPSARRAWWWSLRADCDPRGLPGLVDGALDDDQRLALEEHLRGCGPCRRDRRWIDRVDALLGPVTEGEPSSATLSAFAAGDLAAAGQPRVERYLKGSALGRRLVKAAAAGLAEAERVEAGLEQEAAARADPPPAGGWLHRVLAIPAAPRAVAFAADAAPASSPAPRDRRVLVEDPAGHRLVYYRRGARGRLSLFADDVHLRRVAVAADVDRAPLDPVEEEAEAVVFDLGPLAGLPGRTLRVSLTLEQHPARRYSWTFVDQGDGGPVGGG